jgi:hypothetical protein
LNEKAFVIRVLNERWQIPKCAGRAETPREKDSTRKAPHTGMERCLYGFRNPRDFSLIFSR